MTCLITAFSLLMDYRSGVNQIESELHQVESIYLASIKKSLWDLNSEHLNLNLVGITNFGGIEYVRITSHGKTLHEAGTPVNGESRMVSLPIIANYNDTAYDLGVLEVSASLESVYHDIRSEVVFVFLSSFFKSLILSAFMLLLFHRLVIRHIFKIRNFLESNPLLNQQEKSVESLSLERPDKVKDEFNLLVNGINGMLQELSEHLEHRKNAENKLKSLNSNLEEEVKKRIKEVEKQQVKLQNAARLSSLGEMAGNIAHEINNPLTIIGGYAGMLKKQLESSPIDSKKLIHMSDRIESTVDRITEIIRGLLRLSRNTKADTMKNEKIDLILNDALAICGQKFKSRGIDVKVERPQSPVLASCKTVEIGQVFVNLLNNAYDEIKDQDNPWIKISLREQRDTLKVSFSDSGKGIPEKIRDKIAEPFFTTKPIGEGTGLGLSISRAIAQSHGGKLYLDQKSHFTSFVLELPKPDEKSPKDLH